MLAPLWGCASIATADDWPGSGAGGDAAASSSATTSSASTSGTGGEGAQGGSAGSGGGGGGGGREPDCVPAENLAARWRADDISPAASGVPVLVWPDTAGENDLVGNEPSVPTLVLDALGGHAVVRFDGTDDRLTTSLAEILDDVVFTVFIVSRSIDNSGIRTMFQGGDANSVTSGFSFGFCDCALGMGAHFDTWSGASDSHNIVHLPDAQTTSKTLWTVRRSDVELEVYRNSGSLKQVLKELTLDVVSDQFHVGAAGNGSGFWKGDVAELLFYSVSITSEDREAIEDCLMSRYGLP